MKMCVNKRFQNVVSDIRGNQLVNIHMRHSCDMLCFVCICEQTYIDLDYIYYKIFTNSFFCCHNVKDIDRRASAIGGGSLRQMFASRVQIIAFTSVMKAAAAASGGVALAGLRRPIATKS